MIQVVMAEYLKLRAKDPDRVLQLLRYCCCVTRLGKGRTPIFFLFLSSPSTIVLDPHPTKSCLTKDKMHTKYNTATYPYGTCPSWCVLLGWDSG